MPCISKRGESEKKVKNKKVNRPLTTELTLRAPIYKKNLRKWVRKKRHRPMSEMRTYTGRANGISPPLLPPDADRGHDTVSGPSPTRFSAWVSATHIDVVWLACDPQQAESPLSPAKYFRETLSPNFQFSSPPLSPPPGVSWSSQFQKPPDHESVVAKPFPKQRFN